VVVVKDGGLANVLVYVKTGLPEGQKYEAPKDPVVLDQEGCLYKPRTLAVMVNQPIEIRNSDPVLHNVKAMAKKNRPFNISQPQAGMETIRTFTTDELPVHVECNVHGWMKGNVAVLTHPFFAVSGETGDFAIRGLPAGTYTVEAWHETLGTKTGTATVAADGKATVSFSYGAS
jgi:plastocyanin